jgi:hypothetical protein
MALIHCVKRLGTPIEAKVVFSYDVSDYFGLGYQGFRYR